jgi:ABC-type uncharacterized transport system substrate-binding protein
LVRQTAGPIGVKFAEQHVSSVEELQASLRVIRAEDVDAIFAVSDALVQTHDQRIIDTAGSTQEIADYVR